MDIIGTFAYHESNIRPSRSLSMLICPHVSLFRRQNFREYQSLLDTADRFGTTEK